jgi:hypothetical protein
MRMEKLVKWTVLAGETEVLGENWPDATMSITNPFLPDPGANPDRRCGKPVTNRFSYGVAKFYIYLLKYGECGTKQK